MLRSLMLCRMRCTAGRCAVAVLAGPVLAVSLAAAPALAAVSVPPRATDPATGTWTVQKAPNRLIPASSLGAVSCPAAGWCAAVGTTYNSTGDQVPLAETWNGTSWSRQHTPRPSGSSQELAGVSCVSASFCEAVGWFLGVHRYRPLGEVWNGQAWRLQTIPFSVPPATVEQFELTGVSCVSASFCEAVGYYYTKRHVHQRRYSVAEWWNGSSWAAQPVSGPSGSDGQLYGVSCASAVFCEAVGGGFALQWNGAVWVLQKHVPGTGTTRAVSCPATDFCEAVAGQGGADVWNGSSWAAQTLPGPGSPGAFGVSCVSADFCEASGYVFTSGVDTVSYGAQWNGTAWSQQPVPSRPGPRTVPTAVSCASTSACEMAGTWATSVDTPAQQALTVGWDGTAWTLQRAAPVAASLNSALGSVSCGQADSCEAVGTSQGLSQAGFLAEHWDGTAWTIQPTPKPAVGQQPFQPTGVSCTSASFCEAVGNDASNIGTRHFIGAAGWNGSSWTLQTLPLPQGTQNSAMSAVSCASAHFCLAVTSGGPQISYSYSYTWDGKHWSGPVVTPQGPEGWYDLAAVSCVSASFCEAAGRIPVTADVTAEEWNGSTWTLQTVPVSGASRVRLNGVSCASADACELTGYVQDTELQSVNLAEVWNGSYWSRQPVPMPSGATTASLGSVSCPQADACTAIGADVTGQRFGQQAVDWDGTTWTQSALVQPPAPGSPGLLDLSCTAAATCEAVGSNRANAPSIGNLATLVEAES